MPTEVLMPEPQVQVLDDVVVDTIAAGEVVERPASVVKELVENSLDAGATEVTVAIEFGGKSSIEVIDNGCGMSRENALQAVERFGTSKIRKVDDLLSIASFGFRGEALPSIAAVSKFRMITQPQNLEQAGTELLIEGGAKSAPLDAAGQTGTRIRVEQLFYNVPARKRFLKTERTEANAVKILITNLSLAYPEVRFRLLSDGAELLNLEPRESFFSRASALKLAGKDVIQVSEEQPTSEGPIQLDALLSTPLGAVSGTQKLHLLVNGRVVRDKLLLGAVREGYGGFLKPGRYPSGVLQLLMPPAEVDVNVHPQKSEVRFRRSSAVFGFVSSALRRALEGVSLLAEPGGQSFPSPERSERQGTSQMIDFSFSPKVIEERKLVEFSSSSSAFVPLSSGTEARLSQMRYLGQIFRCYLLLEGLDTFAIVDMHAAHERIMHCRIKEKLLGAGEKQLPSQELLVPEVVELDAQELENFVQLSPALTQLGVRSELFGESAAVIRATPSLLPGVNPEALLKDLLSLPLASLSSLSKSENLLSAQLDPVISRMACHGSIRSGRELEEAEVYQLLEDLESATASAFCPHGRPVVKTLSRGEVEKMFGRVL